MEIIDMKTMTYDTRNDRGDGQLIEHLRSYHDFDVILRYVALATLVTVSFLILMFCTSAGWGAALFVAVVEITLGLYFAKDRSGGSWQAKAANLVITTEVESGHEMIDGVEVDASRPTPIEAEAGRLEGHPRAPIKAV